jgi:dipeptidyl aminopeptidase/acylaminoacyl peptidase
LIALMNRWDPAVVVDMHTTNGSYHRYILTYDTPRNPAADPKLVEFARDTLIPAIAKGVSDDDHLDTFWYGNFEKDHTRWETYPDLPRYGVQYVGLRNRIAILTESYSYAPYKARIEAQYSFVSHVLSECAARAGQIRSVCSAADDRAQRVSGKDAIAIASTPAAAPEKATVKGFLEEEKDGKRVHDEPKDYELDLITRSEAEKTVVRPQAYLLPPKWTDAAETLRRHGIRVQLLREDVELDAEVYTITGITRAERPFQKHALISVAAKAEKQPVQAEAGSFIIPTNQKLGFLISYLLEPESADGLTTWNVFDAALEEGKPFPVLRLPQRPAFVAELGPLGEGEGKKPITYEAVYESDNAPNFNGSPLGGLTWLEDGESYTQFRDGRVMKVDAKTGRATPLYDTSKLAAALAKLPSIGKKAAGEIAGRPFQRLTKARDAMVFEYAGDLYWAKLDGSKAARLTSTPQREELVTLSPDGQFVAFVQDNDLWVVDVETQHARALTTGGSDRFRNGKADWVYYEEVFGRGQQTYWWSPDSGRIAHLQIDSRPVTDWTTINDIPSLPEGEQTIERAPYPKPGTPNPRVKLFTVDVSGDEPREVDLSDYAPSDLLVTSVGWWPDSSRVYCFAQNRTQTWLDFLTAAPDGGKTTRLLRDYTQAWIEPPSILKFLADGSFIVSSERSGFQHLYKYSKEGKLDAVLTRGDYEVRSLALADEKFGWLYFSATLDSPIAENLYRIRLDGSTLEPQRLTTEPGAHRCEVSPTGTYIIDSWSTHAAPQRCQLLSLPDARPVRRLDINPVPDLDRYRHMPTELVRIPMPDGFMLEGSLMRPADFDPTRKYPVWFMTYGGPHAPTVGDNWAGGRTWDQVLSSAGFAVFRADPRPASGKGAQSAWTAYKQLGVQECQDIEDAVGWLVRNYPWVDATRIGMAGHSYGGYMTSYCMTHSKAFAAGIAGAPVTDWRDYDSIYTERYMLTPAENREGYDKSSVVKAAKDLSGRMLLIHGMQDDNVHVQNSTRLIRALQQAGRPFDLMFYPENRHGIGGKHYQRLQYDFITRTLGNKPISQSPDTR